MELSEQNLQEYCELNNIVITLVSLSTCKIRGFCYYDGEEYHVLINNKQCYRSQQKTTVHELIHIFNGHFSCDKSNREQCEKEVKEIITSLKMFDTEYARELFTNY